MSLHFQGRAIREHRLDGHYEVRAYLLKEDGRVGDSATFTTQAYQYRQFQGPLVEVLSLSDRGVDTDSVPGYNLLRIEAQVEVAAAGEITVDAQLVSADDSQLAYINSRPIKLKAGQQTLTFDFPGEAVSFGNRDGPYLADFSFQDPYCVANAHHTTAPYRWQEFQGR